jgi:5-amino-6-(5-phosphoribosylamino)uracil reductase
MYSTLVLAMTADGKIATGDRSPAKFSSKADFRHMEEQVAQADAVLIGAGTIRAHGTTMRILDPELIKKRVAQGQSPQPIQIVCSRSGDLDKNLAFFRQAVPRWLLTTSQEIDESGFDRVLFMPIKNSHTPVLKSDPSIDWRRTWQELAKAGISRLCILGGAEIATALWEFELIDEFQLTICPLILGGSAALTPCAGTGLKVAQALELVEHRVVGSEIFLRYRREN